MQLGRTKSGGHLSQSYHISHFQASKFLAHYLQRQECPQLHSSSQLCIVLESFPYTVNKQKMGAIIACPDFKSLTNTQVRA